MTRGRFEDSRGADGPSFHLRFPECQAEGDLGAGQRELSGRRLLTATMAVLLAGGLAVPGARAGEIPNGSLPPSVDDGLGPGDLRPDDLGGPGVDSTDAVAGSDGPNEALPPPPPSEVPPAPDADGPQPLEAPASEAPAAPTPPAPVPPPAPPAAATPPPAVAPTTPTLITAAGPTVRPPPQRRLSAAIPTATAQSIEGRARHAELPSPDLFTRGAATPERAGPASEHQAAPQAAAGAGRSELVAAKAGGSTRVVRSGDSLWGIASHLLGPKATPGRVAALVEQIWQTNRSRIRSGNPSLIMVGERLVLPRQSDWKDD